MVRVGDTVALSKTYTVAEVQAFTQLTGDTNAWHVVPDAQGQLRVQGLFTVSLAGEIGSALGFMSFENRLKLMHPVLTGEPITCTMTVTKLEEPAGGRKRHTSNIEGQCVYTNPRGTVVATLYCIGIIHAPMQELLASDTAALVASKLPSATFTPAPQSKL